MAMLPSMEEAMRNAFECRVPFSWRIEWNGAYLRRSTINRFNRPFVHADLTGRIRNLKYAYACKRDLSRSFQMMILQRR